MASIWRSYRYIPLRPSSRNASVLRAALCLFVFLGIYQWSNFPTAVRSDLHMSRNVLIGVVILDIDSRRSRRPGFTPINAKLCPPQRQLGRLRRPAYHSKPFSWADSRHWRWRKYRFIL